VSRHAWDRCRQSAYLEINDRVGKEGRLVSGSSICRLVVKERERQTSIRSLGVATVKGRDAAP